MPGLLDNLDIPKWMTPQEWSLKSAAESESIGRNVSGAVGHVLQFMSMAQGAQESAAGLALKKDEFNANMELSRGKLKLQQDAQAAAFRDAQRLQQGAAELHRGNGTWQPETPFETVPAQGNWNKIFGEWQKGTAEGKAQAKTDSDYAAVITHPAIGSDAWQELKYHEKNTGKYSPEWRASLNEWKGFAAQEDTIKKEGEAQIQQQGKDAAKVGGMREVKEVVSDGTKYLQTPDGKLHQVPKQVDFSNGIQSVPITGTDGQVIGQAVPHGNGFTILHEASQGDLKSAVIKAEGRFAKAKAEGDEAKIKGAQAELDALKRGLMPLKTTPATAGKTLKWNSVTNDFE